MSDLNKKKCIFVSHIAVVAAPDHFCHKHHKLTFWYVWFTVLGVLVMFAYTNCHQDVVSIET